MSNKSTLPATSPRSGTPVTTSVAPLPSFEKGLRVSSVHFIRTILTGFNSSEDNLNVASNVTSRRADMWMVPGGLLIKQVVLQKNKYVFVPSSNIAYLVPEEVVE